MLNTKALYFLSSLDYNSDKLKLRSEGIHIINLEEVVERDYRDLLLSKADGIIATRRTGWDFNEMLFKDMDFAWKRALPVYLINTEVKNHE